jgi:site-specific DNA recombinase
MARVSSDEQALGYSLRVQEDNISDYCQRNDILVVHVFREDHSAKNFNRPEFQEFLKFAKKSKGNIDLLLFTTWDRFSRNIQDAYFMISKLEKLGIVPMAIQQPIDLSIPENKMMLAVYLVIPEIDNDRRSIKIREGIRKALESGRWCHAAPRGYSYNQDHHSRSIIVPNDDAKHIRFAFEKLDQGLQQADIIRELKKRKFTVLRSRLSEILRNPVYTGMIMVPAYEDKPAQLVDGLHEGIVDQTLFYRVQRILHNNIKKMNRPKGYRKREELPYRGMLLCSKCHMPLTGSASRSRSGQKYYYYHCNHCHKERFRAEKVEEIIGKVMESFKFRKQVSELYKEMVRLILKGGVTERDAKRRNILDQTKKLEGRLEKLQDMLADGELDPKDYQPMRAKYEFQKQSKLTEFDDLLGMDDQYDEIVKTGTSTIYNLGQAWISETIEGKINLLGSIFPEKLEILEENCRTTKVNDFLRFIVQVDKELKENEKGQLSPYLKLSRQVETTGVEPVTS